MATQLFDPAAFLTRCHLRRVLLLVLILVGVAANAFLYFVVYAFAPRIAAEGGIRGMTPDNVNQMVSSIVYLPGALITAVQPSLIVKLCGIIFVGVAAGQEDAWNIVHHLASSGVTRLRLITHRVLAFIAPIALIVLVPVTFSILVTGVLTVINSKPLTISPGYLILAASLALNGFATYLPYFALTLLIAVATRKVVTALVVVIALLFVLEPALSTASEVLGAPFSVVYGLLPGGLTSSVVRNNPAATHLLDQTTSVVGLLLWSVIFLVATIAIFVRSDLPRAEQAQ